jgi:hypothetical protein
LSEENKDAKQLPQREIRAVEFVLEVSDNLNSNRDWPPTQRKLRGAWRHENTRNFALDTDGIFAVLRQMRDIPGMHIRVNTKRKIAEVIDPLADPAKKDLLQNIQSVYEKAWGKKCCPEKPDRYDDMSADEIKTWIYWSRRFLDAQQCVLVSGSVPEMKEIFDMPGKIVRNTNDDALTDEQRYRPMVFDRTSSLV